MQRHLYKTDFIVFTTGVILFSYIYLDIRICHCSRSGPFCAK